jgi:hypothetical protein
MVSRFNGAVAGVVVHIHALMLPSWGRGCLAVFGPQRRSVGDWVCRRWQPWGDGTTGRCDPWFQVCSWGLKIAPMGQCPSLVRLIAPQWNLVAPVRGAMPRCAAPSRNATPRPRAWGASANRGEPRQAGSPCNRAVVATCDREPRRSLRDAG